MVKSVRLICILVVSLLLGASFVVPPYSYAADGDHSTNADTVKIWSENLFAPSEEEKEKEAIKKGESTRKIYVEDSVVSGKSLGYCFDFFKGFPNFKDEGSEKFSKKVATEELFNEKIKGRPHRLEGSDFNEAILKIIWNGYRENSSGDTIDHAEIMRAYNLNDGQFHNITQHAIWYYTDNIPSNPLTKYPEEVQDAFLALLGKKTEKVTLKDPPENMTLNFYLTSHPNTTQNVLGALPVDKETMEPLPESGYSSSTTNSSEVPAPPSTSTDTKKTSEVPAPPSTSTTTTTKPSETTSTEATSTKATSTESTTTEPTTTSTPAEPDNPQSPELGSSVGTYAIIGLPIAIGTIALIKAVTSTSSSSPQHTNPPVGSTAAAATPAKTTEAPPTQHAPQAKRQLAKTGASVLMVMAIALALVVAGLLLVRRRP